MVQVPRTSSLGRVTPQLGPTVFQTAQVSDATFGGATGAATRAAGQRGVQQGAQLIDQATRERILANETWLKKHLVEYDKRANLLWHGDGTRNNPGFKNAQGQDAIAQWPKFQQSMLDLQTELVGTSGDSRRADMFQAASAGPVTNRLGQGQQHVSEAYLVDADNTSDARLIQAGNNATVDYKDGTAMEGHLRVARHEAGQKAVRNGFSAEAVVVAEDLAGSATARRAVEGALAAEDGLHAQKLFNAWKADGTLKGKDITALEEKVSDGALRHEAQLTTDWIIARTDGPEEALAVARDLAADDPTKAELRDEVVDRLNDRFLEDTRERSRVKQDHAGQAARYVENGGKVAHISRDLGPDIYNTVAANGPVYQNLLRMQDTVSRGEKFSRTSDGVSFQQFAEMDKTVQATHDLAQYTGQWTEEEFEKAGRAKASAKNHLEALRQAQPAYDTGNKVLLQRKPIAVLISTPNGRQTLQALQTEMRIFVDDFVQAGKKPTRGEMETEAIRLWLNVQADPSGLLNSVTIRGGEVGTLTPGQLAVARVAKDDIPVDVMVALELDLARNPSLEVTDELIEDLAGAHATGNIRRYRALLGLPAAVIRLP